MTLKYNDPITFGRLGTAVGLNCTGIDFSENGDQSWTTAPVAEMDIQLPFARQDVFVELEAAPFLGGSAIQAQKVFIYLGGLFVGYYALTGYAVRTFMINRAAVSGRMARLALVIPTAVSPHSLGGSEDVRELGIYLTTITFKTTL
jgi:hypothetical protein